MYDLCTRPEQPGPASADREMESHEEAEVLGSQQPELKRSEEQDGHHELLNKAVPTTTNLTPSSMLGKRHHSLYANLNGFEVEGIHKVGLEHFVVYILLYQFWWMIAYENVHSFGTFQGCPTKAVCHGNISCQLISRLVQITNFGEQKIT